MIFKYYFVFDDRLGEGFNELPIRVVVSPGTDNEKTYNVRDLAENGHDYSDSRLFETVKTDKPPHNPVTQIIESSVVLIDGLPTQRHSVFDRSIEQAKQIAINLIEREYSKMAQVFTQKVSEERRGTWPQQAAEHTIFHSHSGDASELPGLMPFTSTKAAVMGISLAEEIAEVGVKKDLYLRGLGEGDGIRDNGVRQIKAAVNKADIEAALATAKAAAAELLEGLA